MLPAEIIRKKRDGHELTSAEISHFIAGYVNGSVADYQAAALLMAIFFQDMTPPETADLTKAMMNSGTVYTIDTEKPLVDKHSTGGVGDKVSLILAPLAAACGLAVPMVAGRGLGHTGGTLDKLESIPGYNVHLSHEQFVNQVDTLGVALIGQSDDFVPADKLLYALRDVTGTVESIPLLCSSILSKKAASGARAIVMDVKCGSGAFMDTLDGARALSKALIATGKAMGLPLRCLITDMNQPLGSAIGNALEVQESLECLHGKGPSDLRELTLELAAEMLIQGKVEQDLDAARARATSALDSGEAFKIFRKMVETQGGDVSVIDNPDRLNPDCATTEFTAAADGFFTVTNCRTIGIAALALGAGRQRAEDEIDPAVGIMMRTRHGDPVKKGQALATLYYRHQDTLETAFEHMTQATAIVSSKPGPLPLIMERLS